MNGGAGGLDGDLAVTQEQDLLSSHPDVETFSSFSLHGNKQSLTLVTQETPQQDGLFTRCCLWWIEAVWPCPCSRKCMDIAV